jgi:hypothetical protein
MDTLIEWLRNRWALVALIVFAGLGTWTYLRDRPIPRPSGVLAAEEPEQVEAKNLIPWRTKDYRIIPLAQFHIRARVLGAERYRFDASSVLSPVDFALGWGLMSDSALLKKLSIGQSGRWYHWSSDDGSLPLGEITTHSANMHMLPADGAIQVQLLRVREGDIIDLRGYLIRAEGPNGFRWESSLTRTDTGDGACEVVWVEHLNVEARP